MAGKGRAVRPSLHYAPPAVLDPSGVQFVDVARKAGLDTTFTIAGGRPLNILQTTGGGCAFLDFNNDGNLDILLVSNPTPQLYAGDGKGHFKNVGAALGFVPMRPSAEALWQGCAVGDYDNDGYDDIYLSGYRCGQLWHNIGGKRWENVTTKAGLPADWYYYWGTSCGFGDFDGDGRLDLVVGNYVLFYTGAQARFSLQTCQEAPGVFTSCSPSVYYGQNPLFFHNLGAGRFRDEKRGLPGKNVKTLAVAFADYDADGAQDIYLANDTTLGILLHNDGHAHFENRSGVSGTAFALEHTPISGMGADWADYDNDGRLDLIVSNYAGQGKPLYHNAGDGLFTDVENQVGLDPQHVPYLAFGVKWLDYDNDGWPDLIFANGDIADTIHRAYPERSYRYPTQVLRNTGGDKPGQPITFANVGPGMGADVNRPVVGRGLATGDFDNDGRIDVLIVDAEGAPVLLHNENGKVGHWIGFLLIGTGRSNRDALGARMIVKAGGHTWFKEVQTAGSYLSASDKRLLFGLGNSTPPISVQVRWPDGRTQTWKNLPVDGYHRLVETLP